MNIRELFEKIRELFAGMPEMPAETPPEVDRAIQQVDSWDGAASHYPDTAAYCAACLIDVNAAAGREEPAQTHCMLPVRGPGAGADTYVAQAVFAAAGGHGLTQVKRPADVPAPAWNDALRAAAKKIIAAYREMDRYAPPDIYARADVALPEAARALSSHLLNEAIAIQLTAAGHDLYPLDIYHEPDGLYLLATGGGKLYRMEIAIGEGDAVTLGEPLEVTEIHAPATGNVTVQRGAMGWRWAGVGCTALLNRSGEIDSQALFDDFVARSASSPAVLDFYHVGGTRLGSVDMVARAGLALIVGGTVDDTPAGNAAAQTIASNPSGWGLSIAYQPESTPERLQAGDREIPVYTRGILRAVTILPEAAAAAIGTAITGKEVQRTMKTEIKTALVALIGPELADEMERRVDGLNERAADPAAGLIFRAVSAEELTAIQEQITTLAASVAELIASLKTQGADSAAEAEAMRGRVTALETQLQNEAVRREAELPVIPPVPGYRPTQGPTETQTVPSMADRRRAERKN